MRINKKIISLVIMILVMISTFIVGITNNKVMADTGSTARTYTVDASNELIPTQDAYIPVKNIKELNITNSTINTFSNPQDIYYQEDLKNFYVADTGNKRIVVFSKDLSNCFSVGEGILNTPQGVFTNANGDIYVADYGLKEVLIFKADDFENPIHIGKPNHPIYLESSLEFLPSKIVVDSVGTMYIIDSGNANGIVTITSDNEFSGYFGANYVTPSLSFVIRFIFASKEQKKKLYVSPISPLNLAIDDDGLINTISSIKGQVVKKLNIAGTNLFPTNMMDWTDYQDICIGPTGTIYCVGKGGYITEYDQEGNLLFDLAGNDPTSTHLGLFNSPTSIEVDDDYSIFILDGNGIQVFTQTIFSSLIHTALDLYQDGKYSESRGYWEEVLKMNNLFDLAHKGLGNAYLRESMYKEAMAEFKLAKDAASYSNAFWEVRNAWLKGAGYTVLVIVIVLIIILLILNKLKVLEKPKAFFRKIKEKIFKVKIIKEVCYVSKFIKHPLDGFYELKNKKVMSVASATILYIWFFVLSILGAYFVGFSFNTQDRETISLLYLALRSVLPLLLFVICNYLITSITEGSAKLKDVYIGSIVSFAPVLIFMPIMILLSNALTTTEAFIYHLPVIVLYAWSFVLLYFMVKDINSLQFGENNKNLILTILTMVLFIAFGFLLYMLVNQLFEFIIDIFREVIAGA